MVWPFLLIYGSHDMTHTGFRRLTVVNGTPGIGASHSQHQKPFHDFLDKEYPSRRKPLPPGVVETPQYRYPRVALAVGINFASYLVGIRQSGRRKI